MLHYLVHVVYAFLFLLIMFDVLVFVLSVRKFFQFLVYQFRVYWQCLSCFTVEPAAGVDYEGLEVAKQCLSEAFKIDPSSHASSSDSLVDIFSSGEAVDQSQRSVDLRHDVSSSDAPCTSSRQKVVHAKDADRSHLLVSPFLPPSSWCFFSLYFICQSSQLDSFG